MTKVKICGLLDLEADRADAEAVSAFIGLVFVQERLRLL